MARQLIGFVDLINCNNIGDHIGIVCRNDLTDHIGINFIGHDGFIGNINLRVSFIDLGFVGFVSLGLSSLGGLIDYISLVSRCIISLIKSATLSNHWLIGLIGIIGFGLIASSASADLSAHRPHRPHNFAAATRQACNFAAAIIAATTTPLSLPLKLATNGFAIKLRSVTKITKVTITYYCAASLLHVYLLMREKMWWWLALGRKKMWWRIATFGKSYHGDVLQYAKQLFSLRLPQMMKYCIMRECDKIHSWISTTGDLAFSHQQEFPVLNSQKGFWRSLPEISLF